MMMGRAGGSVVDGSLCRRWREGGAWRVWAGDDGMGEREGNEGVRALLVRAVGRGAGL